MFGFVRIAAANPRLRIGDAAANASEIQKQINEAQAKGADIILFPELCLSGYSAGDLFFQESLVSACTSALFEIAKTTLGEDFSVIVGSPLYIEGELYNCAVTLCGGRIGGIAVKSFVSNGVSSYEKRWFSPAKNLKIQEVRASDLCPSISDNYLIPVGCDLVFTTRDSVSFGIEIGSEAAAPIPPSARLCLYGCDIILNPCASIEAVTARNQRIDFARQHSRSNICAYALCSAGEDESTTDLIYSGHSVIAENGKIICQNERNIDSRYVIYADIDTQRIRADRKRDSVFADCARENSNLSCRKVKLAARTASDGSYRTVSMRPFVPDDRKEALLRCEEVFNIQYSALKRRLETVGARPVIGVSGGLDSTLALLVSVEAMRRLGRPASDVHAVTMPCFGTTDRTHSNAWKLMEALGVTTLEISIKDACIRHCRDIGHPIDQYDVTFENIQARERTQVLMDYSCRVGGFVIGTGDLSELALGWCTYNADHMSMYGVNCSVPKTLLRFMIEMMAEKPEYADARDVLLDIIDTPISPELLPPDSDGSIGQETESLVGPYILHDFFLYYAIRYGFEPQKIYTLALRAFDGMYDGETIKKWLKTFYRRFFTQQFKRSCQPDGIKVGSVALSPRGDWKMPSDASSTLWLAEVDKLN